MTQQQQQPAYAQQQQAPMMAQQEQPVIAQAVPVDQQQQIAAQVAQAVPAVAQAAAQYAQQQRLADPAEAPAPAPVRDLVQGCNIVRACCRQMQVAQSYTRVGLLGGRFDNNLMHRKRPKLDAVQISAVSQGNC